MEEAVLQNGLAIDQLHMLVILSLILNVFSFFSFAYILMTRGKNDMTPKLQADIKKLSNDLKLLESKVKDLQPKRAVTELPPVEAFGGFKAEEPTLEVPDESGIDFSAMTPFIDEYNLLAASMSVPKQRQACEKFIKEHDLKMIRYGGMMNFLPAVDVEESNYWAWKIPNQKSLYAIVPNPMIPCDREVYERGGMNTTFEANYKDGVYVRYVVLRPATFTVDSANAWKIENVGELNLIRK